MQQAEQKKRIFVTGGAGYIGSHVVLALGVWRRGEPP